MIERLFGSSARLAGLVVGGVKWVSKLRESSCIRLFIAIVLLFFCSWLVWLVGFWWCHGWSWGGIVDIFFIARLRF